MHSQLLLPFQPTSIRTLGHLLAYQNQFYITVIMMKKIKRSLLLVDQRNEDSVQMHRETHPKIVHRIGKDTEVPKDMKGIGTIKEEIRREEAYRIRYLLKLV